MIIDFINQRPQFANRLTKVTGLRKVLAVLCLLIFIAGSTDAQVSTNTAWANYKRPYDVAKKENISVNEGQFTITKKPQDRHSVNRGCTWRYSTTAAGFIINIDSKNNTGKKSHGINSNYKAQH